MLPELLLMVSLCGTPSPYGADSLDCLNPDPNSLQIVVKARLWRSLRWSTDLPVLVDSLPATSGLEVCFPVDTTVQATYWISSVDAEGQESCLGRGLSFPSAVGVDPRSDSVEAGEEERFYDLAGRRLPHKPDAPGIYWLKPKGKAARRILVFVKTP